MIDLIDTVNYGLEFLSYIYRNDDGEHIWCHSGVGSRIGYICPDDDGLIRRDKGKAIVALHELKPFLDHEWETVARRAVKWCAMADPDEDIRRHATKLMVEHRIDCIVLPDKEAVVLGYLVDDSEKPKR